MAESKCCSCGETFLINIIGFGLVVGVAGYLLYTFINKKIEEEKI